MRGFGPIIRGAGVKKVKLATVGSEAKACYIVLQLPAVIGRGRGSDLTLPHPLVSRHHCELVEQDGRVYVRDLGSLNGTYVADRRITEAEVPDGELLTVGTVTLRVSCESPNDRPPAGSFEQSRLCARAPAADANSDCGKASETSGFPSKHSQRTKPVEMIDRETHAQVADDLVNLTDDLRAFQEGHR